MCADPEAGDHEFGGAEAVVRIVSETWAGGEKFSPFDDQKMSLSCLSELF